MMSPKIGPRKNLHWCIVLVLLFAPSAWSGDIYVSPAGGGDGSITNPIDLQAALDLARTNGSEDTIYLMEGQYDASATGADTFEYGSANNDGMKITLSGSWNSAYTVQDTFEAPSTRLDGMGTSRVMSVHADGVSFDFAMEYMQLENGMITLGGGHGAGLLAINEIADNLNLTLHHVSFEDNRTAIDNANRSYGGGMYSNCYFEMTEGRFKDNHAFYGGAMFIADVPGGDKSLAPKIDMSEFKGNHSGDAANPGMAGGTIFYSVSPVITNSLFEGPDITTIGYYPNSGIDSGWGAGTLTMTNCVLSGFHTWFWGGSVALWDTNAKITNCLFYDNHCGYQGNPHGGGGGAISIYDPPTIPATPPKNVTITNSTFVGNKTHGTVTVGGAIHNRIQGITVINSIFWDNGTRGLYRESGTGTISYSDIEGGVALSNMIDGGNNIAVDPLFVNTTGDSSTWDLRLQTTPVLSPAIDTGDNAAPDLPVVDIENKVRVYDGDGDGTATVDMGAYEFVIAYTIGGSVTGLTAGNNVVLQNNAGDDLTVSADGSFTFATALWDGSAYDVTVLTQPIPPSQTCTVSNGSGTLAGVAITDIKVICGTFPWSMFLPAIIGTVQK